MSIPFSSYKGLESSDSLAQFTRPNTSSSSKESPRIGPSKLQKKNPRDRDRDTSPLGLDHSNLHFSQPTIGLSRETPGTRPLHARNLTSNTTSTYSPDPQTFTHSRDVSDKSLLGDKTFGGWPVSRPGTPLSYNSPYGSSSRTDLNNSQVNIYTNPDSPILSEGTNPLQCCTHS